MNLIHEDYRVAKRLVRALLERDTRSLYPEERIALSGWELCVCDNFTDDGYEFEFSHLEVLKDSGMYARCNVTQTKRPTYVVRVFFKYAGMATDLEGAY